MIFTEEFLTSKRVANYCNRRGIELIYSFRSGASFDDEYEYELRIGWSDGVLENDKSKTEDDCLVYNIESSGLYFADFYQMDNLKDLPGWIGTYDELKNLINYVSSKSK